MSFHSNDHVRLFLDMKEKTGMLPPRLQELAAISPNRWRVFNGR
jgi:hypothetical protein